MLHCACSVSATSTFLCVGDLHQVALPVKLVGRVCALLTPLTNAPLWPIQFHFCTTSKPTKTTNMSILLNCVPIHLLNFKSAKATNNNKKKTSSTLPVVVVLHFGSLKAMSYSPRSSYTHWKKEMQFLSLQYTVVCTVRLHVVRISVSSLHCPWGFHILVSTLSAFHCPDPSVLVGVLPRKRMGWEESMG